MTQRLDEDGQNWWDKNLFPQYYKLSDSKLWHCFKITKLGLTRCGFPPLNAWQMFLEHNIATSWWFFKMKEGCLIIPLIINVTPFLIFSINAKPKYYTAATEECILRDFSWGRGFWYGGPTVEERNACDAKAIKRTACRSPGVLNQWFPLFVSSSSPFTEFPPCSTKYQST